MSIGLLFWVLMILSIVYSGWSVGWAPRAWGGNFLVWVLFALLGWAQFGPAIHG